jgi:hypothetical protein
MARIRDDRMPSLRNFAEVDGHAVAAEQEGYVQASRGLILIRASFPD